jgi:hypothetical protein
MTIKIFLFLALSLVTCFSVAQVEHALSGTASITPYELAPDKPFTMTIQLHLPEGYHAYSNKFKLEIEDPEEEKNGHCGLSNPHDSHGSSHAFTGRRAKAKNLHRLSGLHNKLLLVSG